MANIYIDEISAVTKSDTSGTFLFRNMKDKLISSNFREICYTSAQNK